MVQSKEQDSIIKGCQKGDRKAQEQLYKNYYQAMITLCLRYTKNDADAVEVLNTGFFRVFKNIGQFNQGKASLYTWIRAIIINSCLDSIKAKQKARQYYEIDEAVEVEIPADVFNKIKATELLQLVRRLPPATQGVFNLYAIEGYSHKEIAGMMGISEGTSKWHLSEARKSLKQMLETVEVRM